MSLEIVNVVDRGLPTAEHVHLSVTAGCSLEFFMVADTSYASPGMVSNKLRHHFWFPETKVDAGDQVVLMTGKGTNQVLQRNGYRTFFFYWQLDKPVWNNNGDTAIVFSLNGWASKRVPPRALRLAA